MSKFKIEFYHAPSGVLVTIPWDSEDDYLKGKAFLKELVGGPVPASDPTLPEFYHFESDRQRDAFYDFLHTMKARKT